jgi:hypothetical protein
MKIYPDSIEIFANPSKEMSTFAEVHVETSGDSLHADMHTSGLSPFFLVMPPMLRQVSNELTRITYLFGVKKLETSPTEGVLQYPTPQNVNLA